MTSCRLSRAPISAASERRIHPLPWSFQRTNIQESHAALHSPAPSDRLSSGLIESFNELILPDDNSANVIINTKKLYKATSWRKAYCKVRNGQLGKFYFPVGKIFFLSWKIIFFQLGTFRTPFWRIFVRFWPIMVIISKYQKSFTFSSLLRHKKHFRGRWVLKLDRRT